MLKPDPFSGVLYDLEADRAELIDLAHREPARVTAMSEAFQRWHQVEQ